MDWRQALLEAEEAAWKDLWRRFEGLRAGDWDRPGASGAWTPKDVLAHLACWHQEAVRYLETPQWPEDIEVFNTEAYGRCRGMALSQVQAWSQAQRQRFRQEISLAPEEASQELVAALASCAHEHYAEHLPLLDAFLAR